MQLQITAALTLLSLAATAFSQTWQSRPFRLQLCSPNATLDMQYLFACHTAAAAESLCPGTAVPAPPADGSWTFGYNFTVGEDGSNSGLVTWQLQASSFAVSQTFTFIATTPASNTDMILISFPGGTAKEVTVGFDGANNMFIPDFDATANKSAPLYRWFMCATNFMGYRYTTLNWVQGKGAEKPDNPTCVGVDVKRVFF